MGIKKTKVTLIIILILVIIFTLFYVVKIQDKIERLFYKINYVDYVEKYSNEYGVDKYLVYALINSESHFNEKAVSHKGATGLMQLMIPTAKEVDSRVTEDDLLNPRNQYKSWSRIFG